MTSSDVTAPKGPNDRPRRSDFLTLLCVLTFLSCGLGFIDSVTSYTRTDAVARTERITSRRPPDPNAPPEYFEDRANSDDPIPGDTETIRALAGADFFYVLITFTGALLMFFGRRIGFYVYVLGVLVGLIAPVSLMGFSAWQTSFGVFFSLLFIILYASRLSELR